MIALLSDSCVMSNLNDELLTSLSIEELQILAEGIISPQKQSQLENWLERNTTDSLTPEEAEQFDRLLTQIDQLNILKARARLTLHHLNQASAIS
ncbi:MAG: hypothetical protein KME18_22235 [Phormidium tanganyikae FI6-MK23]|jgi:hypothetical protein|nr:hypothetical protein [Phormidium tanganyikae FI6-MK23]